MNLLNPAISTKRKKGGYFFFFMETGWVILSNFRQVLKTLEWALWRKKCRHYHMFCCFYLSWFTSPKIVVTDINSYETRQIIYSQ